MVDPPQDSNPNKGAISEEDVFTLLQRYSATTVLTLLKEVSQFADVKIDWKRIMEKTETGIKSAREYQMLWRHLAYRKPLIFDIVSDDQPLDDDSDLEYELEAYPLVSTADATEASNCVKALTSGPVNKSRTPNSSSCVLPRTSSEYQQVQKQVQVAGTYGEKLGGNGSRSNNQKKRKLNSAEEDVELLAVRKGESNGERNTTHHTQRGNNSRKNKGTSSIGKLSEAQLATRRALDMAFNDNPSAGSGTVKLTNLPMGSSSKLCPHKDLPQSSVGADPIEAAAVAAGARIGSSSDKETLFKAAQSKNAVHIRGGIPVKKTSTADIASALPPNVHLICTRPTAKPTARPPVQPVSQLPKVTTTSTEPIPPVSQLPKVTATSTEPIPPVSQLPKVTATSTEQIPDV